MSQQKIHWATQANAYSFTAYLDTSAAPKIDFTGQIVVSVKNAGIDVNCGAHFETFSVARPRLRVAAKGQFLMPGQSGAPAELGVLSFMAYAEVSGQDIIPDVWTGSLTYMRDYRQMFNANTVHPIAFRRV